MDFKEEMVSLIVPVYNCEKYLRKSVSAILTGTYNNIEVILINDGSTDDSLTICNQLQDMDKRVKVFSQANQGPSAARNKGIELAVGSYIVFVDSDDEVSKSYVKDLICLIHRQNAILGQVGYTQDINEIFCVKNIREDSLKSCTASDAFKFLWCGGLVDGYLWNKIFVRKSIVENKIFFCEETRIWEDSLFIFEYLSASNGVCFVCENKDYFYRVNDESITHNVETVSMLDAKCTVIKRIAELNQEVGGEKLNLELNKVKVILLSTRAKKMKPINKTTFEKYAALIRKTKDFSLREQSRANIMLFILKCFQCK